MKVASVAFNLVQSSSGSLERMYHAITSLAHFIKELENVLDRNPSFNEALVNFEQLRASLADHSDWIGRTEEQTQIYQKLLGIQEMLDSVVTEE